MDSQTDDSSDTEAQSNEEEAEDTLPVGQVEAVVIGHCIGEFLTVNRELDLADAHEAIAHRRDDFEPLNELLRGLALDGSQVDHVASKQVHRLVENRCERNSSRLMVEHGRYKVTHGSSGLHQKQQDQVHTEELRELVLETDGEVHDGVEDEGHKKSDGDLSEPLGRGVHPHVVHATGSLSHENGLLGLEHNNGGLEVELHLLDGHEVDSSAEGQHIFIGGVVVELPEDGKHEQADDDVLENLSARQSWLTSGQNPSTMHELLDLIADRGFVVDSLLEDVVRGRQLDDVVLSLDFGFDLGSVRVGQVLKLLDIVSLFGVLDGEHLHEEVSGVGVTRHLEFQLLEEVH